MIHTPLIKDQPIASTGCSIPSRYQTFIVDNADKKGFNSGTRRFQNIDIMTDTPGPGHYYSRSSPIKPTFNRKQLQQQQQHQSGPPQRSYSEIVQGQNRKFSRFETPGPNNYDVSKPMSLRKDHHQAHSSSFQSVRNNSKHFCTPAPNAYKPKNPETKSISSSFRSTTRRSEQPSNDPAKRVPSPTHYLIRDKVTRAHPRAPASCFKSTTNRTEISYKTTKDAYYTDTAEMLNVNPGPGSYGELAVWGGTNSKKYGRRGHYLAISAPALPLPPSKSFPGPGQYELVDYHGPEQKARASSMFCSNTDRWANEIQSAYTSKGLPGPSSYNPKSTAQKQSFIFNAKRRWIN